MAIYTSNYARKGTHENAVSISRAPPEWFDGLHLPQLAPTWTMIYGVKDGRMSEEEYTKQYLRILEACSFDWLQWLNKWPDPTYFLCYETPTDFCHRHIFAEWVERRHGWVIPEWLNEKEIEEQRQLEMVDTLLEF